VHTFDPDKGTSMRFLSRVHSRWAPPTVLNLMELEYARMRPDLSRCSRRSPPGIFANFTNRSENRSINSHSTSYNGKNHCESIGFWILLKSYRERDVEALPRFRTISCEYIGILRFKIRSRIIKNFKNFT